jgi:hypothetical protein
MSTQKISCNKYSSRCTTKTKIIIKNFYSAKNNISTINKTKIINIIIKGKDRKPARVLPRRDVP